MESISHIDTSIIKKIDKFVIETQVSIEDVCIVSTDRIRDDIQVSLEKLNDSFERALGIQEQLRQAVNSLEKLLD